MQQHASFNANFYITAAALIPLLYITLSLQGSTFNSLVTHWLKARDELLKTDLTGWPFLRSWIKSTALSTVASAIWYAGIIGEAFAVWALYEQSSNAFIGPFVLLSIFALLSVLAVTTWWSMATARLKWWLHDAKRLWPDDKDVT